MVILPTYGGVSGSYDSFPKGMPRSNNSSLVLGSSYAGGDDDGVGTDSTGRLTLYSYQRASAGSFGETIRHFLMRKDAKSMLAWYGPQLTGTQTQGYSADRNTSATGITWRPWAWIGAHLEANDHQSNHGHISIEVPDTTGALQTRLEIPFVDQEGDTNAIGVETTNIRTHQADFTVSADSGVLRVGGGNAYNKDILLSRSSFRGTSARRWIIRADNTTESGSATGTDFRIVRHNDSGVSQDAPLFIKRSNGRVGIGGTAGALAPGAALHVESMASTVPVALIKQPTTGNDTVAALAVEGPSATKRLTTWHVTGDAVPRLYVLPSGAGTGGELVFGDGTTADTNLYRSAAHTLKTDDKFLTAAGLGVGNSAAATTLGTVTRKMEVFDATGASLGFVPIYNTIT